MSRPLFTTLESIVGRLPLADKALQLIYFLNGFIFPGYISLRLCPKRDYLVQHNLQDLCFLPIAPCFCNLTPSSILTVTALRI